jgi:hypothetical protein
LHCSNDHPPLPPICRAKTVCSQHRKGTGSGPWPYEDDIVSFTLFIWSSTLRRTALRHLLAILHRRLRWRAALLPQSLACWFISRRFEWL